MEGVIRVGVLGGTSAGKTYHFGRDGVLESTLSYCLRGRRAETGVSGRDNVVALVTNVKVGKEVPASTLSVNYMGFDVEIFGRRTIVRWLEYPGQDNVGVCVFLHNLLRAGGGSLIEELLRVGRRLHRVALSEEVSNDQALKDSIQELYEMEKGGGKLLEMQNIARVLYPPEITALTEYHLRSILREAIDRVFERAPKRIVGTVVENIVNAIIYEFVALLAERLLQLRRTTMEQLARRSLVLEAIAAHAVAAAYLGDSELIRDALERLAGQEGTRRFEASRVLPAALNSMCIGPGCSEDSYPHALMSVLMGEEKEWEEAYRQAVWNLLHHRLIVSGPLIASLLLALVVESGILVVLAPFLYNRFAFIYTLKHLATSTNIEVLGGDELRDVIRTLYDILQDTPIDTESSLEFYLYHRLEELSALLTRAEELRRRVMSYAGHGLAYVIESLCHLETEKRGLGLPDKLRVLKRYSGHRISDERLERIARFILQVESPGPGLRTTTDIIDTLNIILIGYWENIHKELSIMHSYVIARLLNLAARLPASETQGEKGLLIVASFFDDYLESLAQQIKQQGGTNPQALAGYTRCLLEATKRYLLLETPTLAHYYRDLGKCESMLEGVDTRNIPLPEPVEILRFRGLEVTSPELDRLFKRDSRVLVPGGAMPRECGEGRMCNIPLASAFLSLIYREVGK
ncbi:MAG: hypothetical protein F7C35_04765 [Desulfurococcales archaeon]|nr:hypothetical protein [Desulfurococcales archaeon]